MHHPIFQERLAHRVQKTGLMYRDLTITLSAVVSRGSKHRVLTYDDSKQCMMGTMSLRKSGRVRILAVQVEYACCVADEGFEDPLRVFAQHNEPTD